MDKPLTKQDVIKVTGYGSGGKVVENVSASRRSTFRFIERFIFTFTIIVLAAVMFVGGIDFKKQLKLANTTTQALRHDWVDIKRVNNRLLIKNESLNITTVQFSKMNSILEEKLAGLKDKDDLARRDLEAYILSRYKVIPGIVAKEIATQIVKLTKEQGVPFSLWVGLTEVESQFKPWAISKKGARGLSQVMPFWIKNKKVNLGVKSKYDLHDVETGIRAGIAVFKIHLKEAKNDINQGLYLYVGKDNTYANKVFNAMGRFEIFRSTLDTALRAEENRESSTNPKAVKTKKVPE